MQHTHTVDSTQNLDIMAKKKTPGVPNRHIYSRISFLYQAATYLSAAGKQEPTSSDQETPPAAAAAAAAEINGEHKGTDDKAQNTIQYGQPITTTQNMSRKLVTDLRAITLKSQIRISPGIKRTICKYCDTLLLDGQTCSSAVENRSKGGKKPWADVLVIKCHTCCREKRYPVNAQRQKRRPLRASEAPAKTQTDT